MGEPSKPGDHPLTILIEDHRSWEVRLGTAMLRFQNRLERRAAESLEPHGLTLPQFDVLATLWHGEGINQQELAERLLVSKGNIVGIIDRTSAAGWVERRPDPADRRANQLYLTDAGRRLLAEAWPCERASMEKIFGRLTEGELRLMHELILRLEDGSREE